MDIINSKTLPALVTGLWLSLAATVAQAQESLPLPDTLTADGLAGLALERNPGVAALQSALAAAEAAVKPAGALEDPMLSYAVAPETFDSELGDRHIVSLSQSLPWPGTLGLQQKAAEYERDAAGDNVAALQLQVMAAAKAAYADWHFVHRALDFNAENRQLLNELISVAATAYGAGRGAQQDVVGAQLREVELQQEALQLERQKRSVAARIRGLLAALPDTVLPPPDPAQRPAALPGEQHLVEQALAANPQLAALRHHLRAAESRVGLAEKAFYPGFKLNAAYVGTLDPHEKRSQIGVAINLPLNRSKREAEVDRRQAQQMELQFRLEDMAANMAAQVSDAYARWQQAQSTAALLENRILPLAAQNLSATRADYGSGNGDFQAVIDAQARLLRTETLLARSQADQWIARADIERLAGYGLEE